MISIFNQFSCKQINQLENLCVEFQPIAMPFEEIVFFQLMNAARYYCYNSTNIIYNNVERFEVCKKSYFSVIKSKYYSNGFKTNHRPLSNSQLLYFRKYIPRVKLVSNPNDMTDYNPIEPILFLKISRACRDYLRGKMNKDSEQTFFDQLNIICDALKPIRI